ncbi:5-methyltetrahydropteroyltriglutamate--homocysteine S-methyltransferase [Streptococcus infantarius subsp. infantarius]|uniref:5-methyltetrahydropteroyltriglutamate-- homocysteine S-methyltransferase n=1 Tax=Streptococcus infantarius TaxID=102684 RepID=UPI001BDA839E|nr:5-methyltetrahydropteroyltriglutamate--homocysteine S-methyltransferase [Streptococcus infantarius]MBT0897023.1 5-methyltetrahydropteroyltriglutamate--homocysteine S-methyltransferase [Streptococcus infantarius subsp. infantarius]MBT0900751.1 5-methyltetrahydropteroyltriglutamate--homocysteine S-methyltransferase [Streptococcus infantarius subsp. infantarius]MBT1034384.1 5-methyltetrahydropteroyltriglutamate--homocysteine S-methyltransferase [Streptococcus infantarius subsp. infantarius]MCO4
MVKVSNLGYPRLGENREWKKLIESYWAGNVSQDELQAQAKELRLSFLKKQADAGLDLIPVGDFSLYDHILDLSVQFGVIPNRFAKEEINLDLFFAIARGNKENVASSMKKWFNTNYHYIVPEWSKVKPHLTNTRLLDLYLEAKEVVGDKAKPVITGPITYVALSAEVSDFTSAVKKLLPLYKQVFTELVEAGATYIQVDEPIFVTDEGVDLLEAAKCVYAYFAKEVPQAKIIFQTYFEALIDAKELSELPVAAFGLDFVHGLDENLEAVEAGYFENKEVFAGVVDGRNIWATDFEKRSELLEKLQAKVGNLVIQPSCSLLHVPVTTKNETDLDPVLKNGLAFADEKLQELELLSQYLDGQETEAYKQHVADFDALQAADFRNVTLESLDNVPTERVDYKIRRKVQQEKLGLPTLPTTTIGSFPQSPEIRRTRLAWKRGDISDAEYEEFIKSEIARWIKIQEDLDIDVLVHGEFERVDMVEFFGQKLAGFTTTKLGWVQSYGSRAVKPPIIYGDVKHIQPLSVKEVVYAQSLTDRPVKGMLTGPITITNWSFERSDISRADLFNQIGLAIKDEIKLLEDAGIAIIQVDEAALREGLPLRKAKQKAYLDDAVHAFRIATSSVKNDTQVHTHMCYSKFNEIINSIRDLDADVISIETSRSHGDVIESFETAVYPLGIGLGVYDIHSPRVPSKEEVIANIERPLRQLSLEQFWVNPDCGLKTRREPETIASLKVLVEATKEVRAKYGK